MVRQSSGPAQSSVFRGIGIDTTNFVSLKIMMTIRWMPVNHDDLRMTRISDLKVLHAVMICFEKTLAMLPARPATLSLLLMLKTQNSLALSSHW